MEISPAEYQFAAEFFLFLVALTGVALAALRADVLVARPWTRITLGGGLLLLGAAAFLHGSLLAAADDPVVLGLRGGGVVLAAVAAAGILGRSTPAARLALPAGLVALAADVGFSAAGMDPAAAMSRAAGAVGLAAALLSASRRSIAARVAASAAATLLLLVLVLSVGLSAILDSRVRNEALSRLQDRAQAEAEQIEAVARDRAALAAGTARQVLLGRQLVARIAQVSGPAPEIGDALDDVANELFGAADLAVVTPTGAIVAVSEGADLSAVTTVAGRTGSAIFQEALERREAVPSVDVVGADAAVVAVVPLEVSPITNPADRQLVGAVIAIRALDAAYLESQAGNETLAFALHGPSRALVAAGEQPGSGGVVGEMVAEVLSTERLQGAVVGDRFVAAAPIRRVDQRPILALVLSQPTTAVDQIREDLFTALFLIALGGTVLAVLFAAVVGERIGGGLRRLTAAAGAIQAGQLGARTSIRSDDEVGVLSTAFDSMAEAVEEKTAALRQAAEDEARLRNRLEAVVAGMGEALVAIDHGGVVTDFNAAAEALFGISGAEARGRPLSELGRVVGSDGADLVPALQIAAAEGVAAIADLEPAAAPPAPVAVTAGPLRDPGGHVAGAVLVLRDLRREREVERMKREFLSRVGHELRTPLAPIMGFAQILVTRDVPADKARELHRTILESGKRLQRIIEMLEFFAAVEAGRQQLRSEPVDLREVIEEVASRHGSDDGGRHRITRRVSRDLPEVVSNRYWLTRALEEMVDNAIKFSPEGGTITVRAEPVADRGTRMVALSVTDRGIGMSPEQVDAAFREWVQGDESDTRSYGGLGLGLALVRRVVEGQGGRVAVASTRGKGSKFSALLPAVPIQEGDATRAVPGAGDGARRRRRLRAS